MNYNSFGMELNWIVVLLVAAVVIALIVYLIKKNIRDEEEYVRKLNENYPKFRHDE